MILILNDILVTLRAPAMLRTPQLSQAPVAFLFSNHDDMPDAVVSHSRLTPLAFSTLSQKCAVSRSFVLSDEITAGTPARNLPPEICCIFAASRTRDKDDITSSSIKFHRPTPMKNPDRWQDSG